MKQLWMHTGGMPPTVARIARGAAVALKRLAQCVLVALGLLLLLLGLFIATFLSPYFSSVDPGDLTACHPFKSEALKEKYLAYYDLRGARWPVAQETRFVETRWGTSFVRISGPKSGPPLVLLPGGGANSLMWAHVIRGLAASRRVYALDNLGDIGRSVYRRPIASPDDVAASLDDVFTALGLGRDIDLVGMSYGGWQTAELARLRPERLRRAVLIAPAATVFDLPPDFAWRGILLLLPHRAFLESMMRWSLPDLARRTDPESRAALETMTDDGYYGMRAFDLRMAANPRKLSDAELGSIRVPTLFVVGEHETLYPAEEAVARLRRAAPRIRTAIVPGAGHDLLVLLKERATEEILGFLSP